MSVTYKTVAEHLLRLEQFLGELEHYVPEVSSLDQYLSKTASGTRRVIERELQLALEATLSITRMIISLEHLEKREEIDEMIIELGKFGVFPESFAKEMKGFGGFRNVLVHGYAFIDNEKVYQNLQRRGTLKRFAQYVADYLKPKLQTMVQ